MWIEGRCDCWRLHNEQELHLRRRAGAASFLLSVSSQQPALDTKDGPALSEVAALSFEQGGDILTT